MSQVSKVEFEMKEGSRGEREDEGFLHKDILPRYTGEIKREESRIHQSVCRLRSHPNLLSGNVERGAGEEEIANRNRHFSNI